MLIGGTGILGQLGQQQTAYRQAHSYYDPYAESGAGFDDMPMDQVIAAYGQLGGQGGGQGLAQLLNSNFHSQGFTAQDFGLGPEYTMPALYNYVQNNPNSTLAKSANDDQAFYNTNGIGPYVSNYIAQQHPGATGVTAGDANDAQFMEQLRGKGTELGITGGNTGGLFSMILESPQFQFLKQSIAMYGAASGAGSLATSLGYGGDAYLPGALGANGGGSFVPPTGDQSWGVNPRSSGVFDVNGGLNTLGTSGTGLGTGSTLGTASGGSGMSFFGDILNTMGYDGSPVFDMNGGLGTLGTNMASNPLNDWWNTGSGTTDFLGDPTQGNAFNLGNSAGGTVPLDSSIFGGNNPIGNYLQRALSSLTSGGGAAGGAGGAGGSKSILDQLLGAAPSALTSNYLLNQLGNVNTNQLQGLFDQYNPQANAAQYDTQTAAGRDSLNSSLAARGVAGSSFGDQALSGYNTQRDVGRGAVINQGVQTQAGIGQNITADQLAQLDMRRKILTGGLFATGQGLGNTQNSFNLNSLLGL